MSVNVLPQGNNRYFSYHLLSLKLVCPILRHALEKNFGIHGNGYVQSSSVTLTVISGGQSNPKITSSHNSGTKTYAVNSGGEISFK
jgi:hypothetical protein